MSSTDELLRELEEDSSTRSTSSETPAQDTRRARARRRAVGVFSPKKFLAALAFAAGGLVLGSAVPLVPGTGLLGIAFAAFVYGLVVSDRRYLESGVASALVFTVSFALFNFGAVFVGLFDGVGPQVALAAIGVVGFLAGVVGTYFGRDLRAGLTADIGEQ
ncbi:hypothetical protein [Halomarina oriensis]|uniref:DUF5518 domain-containing protein n=1 Tax=Halomarina oriensis TaxID=671145 RepID=A0A6B0GSK7_9EURY|nr:hypothetical protein [Halomarina oriensis]MWG35085.1 hypothetical protein [Halomarina oriensis]